MTDFPIDINEQGDAVAVLPRRYGHMSLRTITRPTYRKPRPRYRNQQQVCTNPWCPWRHWNDICQVGYKEVPYLHYILRHDEPQQEQTPPP